jgi:hypothetical protein
MGNVNIITDDSRKNEVKEKRFTLVSKQYIPANKHIIERRVKIREAKAVENKVNGAKKRPTNGG